MLTDEQLAAVQQGEAIRLTENNIPIIVISEAVYEKFRKLMDDDSEWTEGEMQAMAAQTFENADKADDTYYSSGEEVDAIMAEDDANDPYLEEFQRLHGRKHE